MKLLARLVLQALLLLAFACADPHYVDNPQNQINTLSDACEYHFNSEDLCLQTQWVQKPSESNYGEMLLTFTDSHDETRLLDPKNDPFIVLWMPSMGHGSSPVKIERLDVGKFRAYEIFFIMPGPWDIHYQLKSGLNVVEEKIQKITI